MNYIIYVTYLLSVAPKSIQTSWGQEPEAEDLLLKTCDRP